MVPWLCSLQTSLYADWDILAPTRGAYKTDTKHSNKHHILEYTAEDTINKIHKQTWKQHKIGEKNHMEIMKHKAKIKKCPNNLMNL